MKKKSKSKKVEKLHYETDKVSRWNICQKIAKLLYRSEIDISFLEKEMTILETKDVKEIKIK